MYFCNFFTSNPTRDLDDLKYWHFSQNTLRETKIRNLHRKAKPRESPSLSYGSAPPESLSSIQYSYCLNFQRLHSYISSLYPLHCHYAMIKTSGDWIASKAIFFSFSDERNIENKTNFLYFQQRAARRLIAG